jgi:hypothetical protein
MKYFRQPPPQNYNANNFMWAQIYTASSYMEALNYIGITFMYLILASHTKERSQSHFYTCC